MSQFDSLATVSATARAAKSAASIGTVVLMLCSLRWMGSLIWAVLQGGVGQLISESDQIAAVAAESLFWALVASAGAFAALGWKNHVTDCENDVVSQKTSTHFFLHSDASTSVAIAARVASEGIPNQEQLSCN